MKEFLSIRRNSLEMHALNSSQCGREYSLKERASLLDFDLSYGLVRASSIFLPISKSLNLFENISTDTKLWGKSWCSQYCPWSFLDITCKAKTTQDHGIKKFSVREHNFGFLPPGESLQHLSFLGIEIHIPRRISRPRRVDRDTQFSLQPAG